VNFFYHVRLAILWFATIVIGGCLALGQVARPFLRKLEDAAAKIAKGDLTSAESQLQNVLDTDTNNYQAMNLLGVVRAQQAS
jgi:Flp pilus assembly protein TadD